MTHSDDTSSSNERINFMKVITLLLALGFGAWYILVDARKLDESQVRAFYETHAQAVLARDPQAQCAVLNKSAVLQHETLMSGHVEKETLNQPQACAKLHKSHQFFEEIGAKAGGRLTIEYDYELANIEISADHNNAAVVMLSTLKMGDGFMQFRTTSTEQLARYWGQVQRLKVDANTKISWSPNAMADPAKHFKSD
jgi:hypothetical protein